MPFHYVPGKISNLVGVWVSVTKAICDTFLLLSAHRSQDPRKDSQRSPRKALPPAFSSIPVTSNLPTAQFPLVLLTSLPKQAFAMIPISDGFDRVTNKLSELFGKERSPSVKERSSSTGKTLHAKGRKARTFACEHT